MSSYIERSPPAALARVVRTMWIQRTGDELYVQRHLPTGGVEIHVPMGGSPRFLGPLTGPLIEVIPARSTIVGVRFHAGAAPALPFALHDLSGERVAMRELTGSWGDGVEETMARAETPERALVELQVHLLRSLRGAVRIDPLVTEAVRALMPWRPITVEALAARLTLSVSQLRRRCLRAVGLTPKVLQRTLRFQGFLALAQARGALADRRAAPGVSDIALELGYADQAHLTRECLRLTGLTPGQLLGTDLDRCACGHDHSASYGPFLAGRSVRPSSA